jgi:ATP-dependent DNA ligase
MMPDYLIHKAVDLAKVNKVRRAVLSQPGYLDREYLGQAKYDGCNVIFLLSVAGEEDQVLSRTGERVRSMEWLLPDMHRVFAHLIMQYGGIAVLGEAWHPKKPFAEISGLFRKQRENVDLGVRAFDLLTWGEWQAGRSEEDYMTRLSRLLSASYDAADADIKVARTHFTPGTSGHETWQGWCNELKARGGYDGLILRDPRGTWARGSGVTGEIIKLKPVLSFDLRVIGLEEGKGKHAGRLGAIVVSFGDRELRVGTGFTDAERREYWDGGLNLIGAIVEVEAMDFSADGLLREPRFKGVRFDKLEADYE